MNRRFIKIDKPPSTGTTFNLNPVQQFVLSFQYKSRLKNSASKLDRIVGSLQVAELKKKVRHTDNFQLGLILNI